LKLETGKTALELIHLYVISEAKNMLVADERSISEIAYQLGFSQRDSYGGKSTILFPAVQKRSRYEPERIYGNPSLWKNQILN